MKASRRLSKIAALGCSRVLAEDGHLNQKIGFSDQILSQIRRVNLHHRSTVASWSGRRRAQQSRPVNESPGITSSHKRMGQHVSDQQISTADSQQQADPLQLTLSFAESLKLHPPALFLPHVLAGISLARAMASKRDRNSLDSPTFSPSSSPERALSFSSWCHPARENDDASSEREETSDSCAESVIPFAPVSLQHCSFGFGCELALNRLTS